MKQFFKNRLHAVNNILSSSTPLQCILIIIAAIAGLSILFGFIASIVMGIWWIMWKIWTLVIPCVFPDGPVAIIHPSYWLFVGELLIVLWIRRLLSNIFQRTNKGNK